MYPCAVWKPENSAASSGIVGPIRNCNRNSHRPTPYSTTQRQLPVPAEPPLQPPTNPQQVPEQVNLAQPSQIVVAPCVCGGSNNNVTQLDRQAPVGAPMLFVPLNAPNFASPVAVNGINALHTNQPKVRPTAAFSYLTGFCVNGFNLRYLTMESIFLASISIYYG